MQINLWFNSDPPEAYIDEDELSLSIKDGIVKIEFYACSSNASSMNIPLEELKRVINLYEDACKKEK